MSELTIKKEQVMEYLFGTIKTLLAEHFGPMYKSTVTQTYNQIGLACIITIGDAKYFITIGPVNKDYISPT